MEAGGAGLAAAAVVVLAAAAAAANTSMVAAGAGAAGAAATSARPSGRSQRNLCRADSRMWKRDCSSSRGPLSHSRCLHIFRCSRERCTDRSIPRMNTAGNTTGMCSRKRTIPLQETAAAVSEEESAAVETVEAAKCTGDHSRCSRCQEDIGCSRCTRSLALRHHRCQHRNNRSRYKN